jgi:hypothetical protein
MGSSRSCPVEAPRAHRLAADLTQWPAHPRLQAGSGLLHCSSTWCVHPSFLSSFPLDYCRPQARSLPFVPPPGPLGPTSQAREAPHPLREPGRCHQPPPPLAATATAALHRRRRRPPPLSAATLRHRHPPPPPPPSTATAADTLHRSLGPTAPRLLLLLPPLLRPRRIFCSQLRRHCAGGKGPGWALGLQAPTRLPASFASRPLFKPPNPRPPPFGSPGGETSRPTQATSRALRGSSPPSTGTWELPASPGGRSAAVARRAQTQGEPVNRALPRFQLGPSLSASLRVPFSLALQFMISMFLSFFISV